MVDVLTRLALYPQAGHSTLVVVSSRLFITPLLRVCVCRMGDISVLSRLHLGARSRGDLDFFRFPRESQRFAGMETSRGE